MRQSFYFKFTSSYSSSISLPYPIWWGSKGSINIMPSKIMEQRHLSSSHMSNGASSFFSEEIRFPSERQVGLPKAESVPNHCGNSGSKTVSSSSLEKLHPMSGNQLECLEFPQAYVFEDQKSKISNERHLMGVENSSSLSVTSWKTSNQDFQSGSSVYVQPGCHFVEEKKVGLNELHYERGFFSSSLSDMFNRKISLSSNNVPLVHSVDTTLYNFREDKPPETSEDIEAQTIRNLLPDDDDLLSGIMDDVEYVVRPNFGNDTEDDLFYSGGGMELESADATFISNKPSEFVDEGASNGPPRGLSSSFATEHSQGEHPSRTLVVGNINSNVEESELRDLFEQYGDICALYTACKHRGFVMISYFDIRAAKNAMSDLQNKRFGHWKLDIHFSVSKENPYDNDTNKGTLVVFDLGSSVSNEDLLQIFGVHGDIKEIRETQHDHQKKYVEFYDVRAAEAALHALDKCDIGGKRIKLELSYPGDAKKCLMWHLFPGLDQEERRPGNPLNNLSESLNSAIQAPLGSTFHGASSRVPYNLSSLMRAATVGNHSSCLRDFSNTLGHINHLGYQCTTPTFHPHSLPEYQSRVNNGIHFNSPSAISAMDIVNSEGMNSRQIHRRVSSSVLNSHSFEHREAAFGVVENGTYPLHAQQYLWNGSETYHHHHPPGAMMWHSSPSFVTSIPPHPLPQMHGLPRAPSHLQNTVLPSHQHHVGSAPSENPSLWDRRHAYAGDSVEVSAFHGGSLGNIEFTANIFPRPGGNFIEPSISPLGTQGRNVMPGSYDHPPNDRVRSRRSVASANQLDNKKQYELDIDRIMRGKDSKTTLMIKNIPNKYTSKMLLATIDENHRGTYDFIYLPIDFKNKCNVGYAFINMIDPQHIIPIFQAFNGKKWEKFNSEKVASLAYARIQGKQALIAHFQNSSLMNEDKRCRPIIFHTDGPDAGDQEPFPMGVNTRSRLSRSRTACSEANGNGSDSSSGSSKD